MYSHGGHTVIMNGNQQGQKFGIQMPKQTHNHPAHQQNHHQTLQNQPSTYSHHYSYSGGLSAGTPNFVHGLQPNDSVDINRDGIDEPASEHWQQQIALAEEARAAGSPHYHARNIARDQKGINSSTNGAVSDGRSDERSRASKTFDRRRQNWMALDFGGQGLKALTSTLFKYDFLVKLYLNWNTLTELPPEIGTLRNLVHLDLSHNKLKSLPAEIGMLTNLRKFLITDNSISHLPHELGYLYKLDTFGIYGNPLPEEIKIKVVDGGATGLIDYLRDSKPPSAAPLSRAWVTIEESSTANQAAEKVTAVSYNILCPCYATRSQHPCSPETILNWDTRKERILDEIRGYEADIICLQEMDRFNYDEYFRPKLSYDGYKGYFAQKSRADTMGGQAKFVDGCGTFWKDQKYLCLDQQYFVFGRKAVNRPDAKASADMLNRVWARDDIAVVTFLENRMTGTRLIVANTHVFWDPAYKDVKLIQVAVLLEELTNLAEKWSKTPPCTNKQVFRFSDEAQLDEQVSTSGPSKVYDEGSQIPLLICGDFNSEADSAVCDLLAHGGFGSQHSDFDDRNYGSYSADGIKHPFTLKSSYDGEMKFTNHTPTYTGVLDYIWYSSNSLRVQKLLAGIDENYISKIPGFPNEHFPSDHVALKAEFAVVSKKKGMVSKADFGSMSLKH